MSALHDHLKRLERLAFPLPRRPRDGCWRCGGFLVGDACLDLSNDNGAHRCEVRRCVQCGDVVDDVILHNRRRSRRASAEGEAVMVGAGV